MEIGSNVSCVIILIWCRRFSWWLGSLNIWVVSFCSRTTTAPGIKCIYMVNHIYIVSLLYFLLREMVDHRWCQQDAKMTSWITRDFKQNVMVGHIWWFQSSLGILSLGHVEGEWLIGYFNRKLDSHSETHAIVTPSLLSWPQLQQACKCPHKNMKEWDMSYLTPPEFL